MSGGGFSVGGSDFPLIDFLSVAPSILDLLAFSSSSTPASLADGAATDDPNQ